jgi:hypothetical protein
VGCHFFIPPEAGQSLFLSYFSTRINILKIMPTIRTLLAGILFLSMIAGTSTVVAHPPAGTLAVVVPSSKQGDALRSLREKTFGRKDIGFLQRTKITMNVLRHLRNGWLKAEDPSEGDRLAKSSRTLGIIGISCLGGIIIPYVGSAAFLAALVLGIIAIVQGRSARRLGSKMKTGEKLGYITIGLWGLLLLLAVAALYLLVVAWGG